MTTDRRTLLKAAGLGAFGTSPLFALSSALAQAPAVATATAPSVRVFEPKPGKWRTFEVTTRVDVMASAGATRVWLPVPSLDTSWQKTLDTQFSSSGRSHLTGDGSEGVRMVYTEFAADAKTPFVEVTSRVQTQDRRQDLSAAGNVPAEEPAVLRHFTRATKLIPTDGIVRKTALAATKGANTDVEKTRAIYDWVVANSFRDPKVLGCGEGDIKTMLETGNMGGKCADINALFVGLCRSVGVPARDVYGIRLVRSEFGYKELSGNPASLKGAQHCRAEAYLQGKGWVAMDPADVAKVMRLETAEWIKTTSHPVVQPVYKGLLGGWEGNWMGWNTAHDVALPGSKGERVNFFMYPTAENDKGRFDSYAPDSFKYQITAREI